MFQNPLNGFKEGGRFYLKSFSNNASDYLGITFWKFWEDFEPDSDIW